MNNTVVLNPLHNTTGPEGTTVTFGIGLTVILKVLGIPKQVFEKEVTVKIACTGIFCPPLFVVKGSIFPEPDVAIDPIVILVRVQLKIAPAIVVETKDIASVITPLHLICEAGCAISGAALAV